MNDLFLELVQQRLKDAIDCPAKTDVIEEITADLTEKYNELLSGGMEPEDARAQVEAGIGDLSEIVAFINEANRCTEKNQKAGNTDPFAGLNDAMRQLGKAFSTPAFREVANDLKNAASHSAAAARDVVRDAKEPLRNMASSVKSTVKSAVKSVTRSNSHSARYDYTVPSDGLLGVDVQTIGGEVLFGVSQDDNIYIVELTDTDLSDEHLAQIQSVDGILRIRQGQRSSAGNMLFSYGMLHSDYEIYLPRRAWNLIRVSTASGHVALEKDMEIAQLSVTTFSGDMECPQLCCGSVNLKSTSGDIECSGSCDRAELNSVSGDISFSGSARQLQGKTVSGDMEIRLCNMPEELALETISGDTRLHLPDNGGFALRYQRISGDLRSDFDLRTSLNAKSGIAVYLDGGSCTYSMNTVSGDLRIYRR